MDRYEKSILQWDEIFKNEKLHMPQQEKSGNEDFDRSLSWLTDNASSVIDFGCASGALLFQCSRNGTAEHIGIDLSPQAIANAQEKAKHIPGRRFLFICGGADTLRPIGPSSMDAAILSNILDNLYPEDAHSVLAEIKRILKPGGRLLVKLNPYLPPERIAEYGMQVIEDNLLDDGMILWNNSTPDWDRILQPYFHISQFHNLYFEEHNLQQRLYRLTRP